MVTMLRASVKSLQVGLATKLLHVFLHFKILLSLLHAQGCFVLSKSPCK